MKLLFFSYFCTWLLFLACLWWGSAGQSFENPNVYFQKFEFDWVNRGSFNITPCLKDLMNCFELVKADVMCSWRVDIWMARYYDTICPRSRITCNDYYLDYDFWHWNLNWKTWERVCKSDYFNEWT